MRTGCGVVFMFAAAWLAGCSDPQRAAHDAGARTNETAGAAGQAGAASSAAGSGGTVSGPGQSGAGSAAPPDSGAAGADPADDGNSEDLPDAGPAAACAPGEARFSSGAGTAYVLRSHWRPNFSAITDVWRFQNIFGTTAATEAIAGFALVSGPGTYPHAGELSEVLPQRVPLEVSSSFWALESTPAALGPLFCTAPESGSTLTLETDEVQLDLRHVATLQCPGAPVAGELSTCLCGDENATGTIDGTAWSSRLGPSSFGLSLFEDGSHLIYEAENVAGGYRVVWGLLITATQGPFGGQVFCIAAGSGDLEGGWTFQDFSRLDPCPTRETGTLTGCTR